MNLDLMTTSYTSILNIVGQSDSLPKISNLLMVAMHSLILSLAFFPHPAYYLIYIPDTLLYPVALLLFHP